MSSVELARLSLTRTPGGIAVKLTDWRRDCTERERERGRIKRLVSSAHTLTWRGQMSSYCIHIYVSMCVCVLSLLSPPPQSVQQKERKQRKDKDSNPPPTHSHTSSPAAGSNQTASTFAICNSLTGSVSVPPFVPPFVSPSVCIFATECVVQQVTATLRIRRVCARQRKQTKRSEKYKRENKKWKLHWKESRDPAAGF